MDIYGFYHIGVIGRWRDIYEDQIESLDRSGLLAKTKKIFIGVAGGPINIDIPEKSTIVVHNHNLIDGEVETLRKMHKFCGFTPPSKIWYLHTKGASHPEHSSPEVAFNVDAWRKYLEYFCIEKHQDCIDALDEFQVCGPMWGGCESIFIGNFWWARSDYVKTITDTMEGRMCAEFNFINSGKPTGKNFGKIHWTPYTYRIANPYLTTPLKNQVSKPEPEPPTPRKLYM